MTNQIVVIGGPISVGKSSLVERMPFNQVNELDDNPIQDILLEYTYKKTRVAPTVIETYFLISRANKYKEYAKDININIFDRSIFESLWFAKENMDKTSFAHFKTLWEKEILDLIKEFGKPKIYILLTMSWETFKERLFCRGREVEVVNFQQNEEFFKKHIKEYEEYMLNVFKKFNLNYKLIHTDDLNQEQVFEKAMEALEGSNNG